MVIARVTGMVRLAVAAVELLSVTFAVKVELTAEVVGCPEITPAGLKVSPAGRDPVSDQV